MDRNDNELVERWLRGDATGFEALVRRWQQPVARTLNRLVARPDIVPDLCQDVFLKVFRARSTYRENGAFASWLYRVTINVARDALRRLPAHPTYATNPDEQPGAELPPEARCAEQETRQMVELALSELPPALREVLVLRYYEGLPFEEIARLTGVPASTLKSRFTNALMRLKKRLEQIGNFP